MRPNYGFDAPVVIFMLLIFGMVSLTLGFLVSYFLPNTNPIASLIFKTQFFVIGAALVFESFFMVYTSLSGKKKFLQKVVRGLQLHGSEQVLDVGCGRGLFTIEVAKKLSTGKVVGIDIWKRKDQTGSSLENAEKNARIENVKEKIEFVTADMSQLPFPDQSFDIAVSSLAIHNVRDKEQRKKTLSEISRVLKPNARLIIIDMQGIDEYAEMLEALGWHDIQVSKRNFRVFPPLRLLFTRR